MDGTRVASGARWFVGGLAGALVLFFAMTAAAPARAAGDGPVTLWLDQSDGPPGTKVIATAWGYADCHASAATSPADGGVKAGGGVVEVFWEGLDEAVGSAVVPANGVVEVPFSVPTEATAQRYSIVARCVTNPKLTDDDLFVVRLSEPPAVVPPKTVSPPSVSPSPSPSPRETVTPETPKPQLVRVPRVVGLKVADAKAKLSALGLVPRVTSGDGGIVASQSPTAGSTVGAGHAVRITVEPAVVAPPPVPVPDPTGEQVDPVSSGNPFPWSKTALLALGVLAFCALTYLVARRWLDRRWVRRKLRVVVPTQHAVDPRLTESDIEPPMPVVRLEPHADAGVHTLKGD